MKQQNRLLAFILSTVLLSCATTKSTSIVYSDYGQEQAILRKSTSHYCINDSTMVADSMFVTLTYYDKNGERQKEEETHYLMGKAHLLIKPQIKFAPLVILHCYP